ncbi:MAG: hypothetical protein IJK12_06185 [Clostridia bacterium]|nr:hypothetical protein [Clostridia bacterium]
MKRRTILILFAALLLLAACQPTPEEPVVVGKDQTGMIEKAKAEIPPEQRALSVRERLGVPERLTYSYRKGFLSIDVDAEVIVPDGELPIVRAFPENFDQNTVTAFWNALVGDVPMTVVVQEETKETILERINWLMQIAEGNPENYGYKDRADVERRIAALWERYREAPEANSGVRSDGTLQKQTQVNDKGQVLWSRTLLYAESAETGYRFSVFNNRDNKMPVTVPLYDELGNETGTATTEVKNSAQLIFIKNNEPQAPCYVWDRKLGVDDPRPETVDNSLTIAPKEAMAFAEQLLIDTGAADDYAARHVFLIRNYEGTVYAYRIVCEHVCRDIPILMTGNLKEGRFDTDEEDAEYAERWDYEELYIDVNDGGVYCVQFRSPLAVGDVVVEESNLLPFKKIQQVMKKMFPIRYENETKDYLGTNTDWMFEKKIDRVELGLWRIREKDSIERGLLVPVWVFYAQTKHAQLPLLEEYGATETYRAVLIINAVDGSIIDPAKGY